MMKSVLTLAAICSTAACTLTSSHDPAPSACAFAASDTDDLTAWRDGGFETEEPDRAATEFASCLGDADAFLRDKIGYEGLTSVLRAGQVTETTRRDLIASLTAALDSPDADGVHAPFAALGLSELSRTDRVEAFLNETERAQLVSAAAEYLGSVTDYRAFSDAEGWRHGVAHGADFAMQLALNPNVSKPSLVELRQAVSNQIAPRNGHAYTHGEPERLARPILFMAARGEISADDWETWFGELADPAPLASWGDAFHSEQALVRLHNLKAFAQTLYINASLSQNPNMEPIETGALELLKTLP